MKKKLIFLLTLTIMCSMSFPVYAGTDISVISDPKINAQDREAYFDDQGLMDAINSISDIQKKRALEEFLCTPAYSFVSYNDPATDMELFHQQFLNALNLVESVKDLPLDEFTKIMSKESEKYIEDVLSKRDIVVNENFVTFAKKYHPEYVEMISKKIKEQPVLNNTIIIPEDDNLLSSDTSISSVHSRFYYTSSNYMSYFPNARLECEIEWKWDDATGKITYLAPKTTAWIINNSDYWWDGTGYKVSREKLSTDGYYGYVNKLKGFYYKYMSFAGKLVPEGVNINVRIYQSDVNGDRSMKVGYQDYENPMFINWYW